MPSRRKLGALAALVVASLSCSPNKAERSPRRDPLPRVRRVAEFRFEGDVIEDKDLSGIAMMSRTHGMLAADEKTSVQFFRLDPKARVLEILGSARLLDATTELDIEGLAVERFDYYVVGSHGLARRRAELEDTRNVIFRVSVDPATGMPIDGIGKPSVTRSSLTPILKTHPRLQPYLRRPLQLRGLNIEGLAVRNGQLLVGLRAPNLQGKAAILEVPAARVFDGMDSLETKLRMIDLGAGYGIRAMDSTKDGFLMIVGNSGVEPSKKHPKTIDYVKGRSFRVVFWSGKGSAVKSLATLEDAPGKAEAMVVLKETDDYFGVLVMYDGVKQGRPSVYRIPKNG